MAQQLIAIGTVVNDDTGDPLRTAFDKDNDNFSELYALQSQTINAGAIDFAGAGSDENKISAAVAAAVAVGADRVIIPAAMLPFNASLVTFDDTVQMVREGGEYSVFDWRAYGAAGDETQDDAVSIRTAINGCIAKGGGRSYGPSGRYRVDTDILVVVTDPPISLTIFGEFASTVLVPAASGCNVVLNIGSSSSDPQILSRIVVQGLQIDGINAGAGTTGCKIGDSTITNPPAPYSTYATFRDVSIYNFLGAGSIGLWVSDLVVGNWDNCYVGHCTTDLLIDPADGNFPTVLTFTKTHFRSATGNGIVIENGFGITFERCVIEANALHGVKVVPTGGSNVTNLVFRGCWIEGNYQSDSTKWQVHVDGTNAGTISVHMANCSFAGLAKSIYLDWAHNCVIDNCVPTNFAGSVTIGTTSVDGKLENWPDVSADYATRFVNGSPTTFRYIYPEMDDVKAAWLTWAPTISPISGGTWTAENIYKAAYKIIGKTMFVTLIFDGTTSIANAGLYATLPTNIRSKDNLQFNLCRISQTTGINVLGAVEVDGANPTSSLIIYKMDGATIAAGASVGARANLILELF